VLGTIRTRSSVRRSRRHWPRPIRASSKYQPYLHVRALLVAADAYKRAGSTDPKALADAIRATNITDNASIGPGIQFNAKGQNDKVKDGAIQIAAGSSLRWRQKKPPTQAGVAAGALPEPRLSRSVSFDVYLNVAVGGVLTGLVYGLMALGLSVIFGVVRVVNFAMAR